MVKCAAEDFSPSARGVQQLEFRGRGLRRMVVWLPVKEFLRRVDGFRV